MKKILFTLVVVIAASVVQATSVAWQFAAPAAQEGSKVYALLSMPEKIESIADITSATSFGEVVKNGRSYGASGKLAGFSEESGSTVDYYLCLVGSSNGEDYYFKVAMTGTTYDPNGTDQPVTAKFDGSKTIGAVGSEGWTKISGATPPGPGGDVPEPTSGLLLALGGAALALRRKQK